MHVLKTSGVAHVLSLQKFKKQYIPSNVLAFIHYVSSEISVKSLVHSVQCASIYWSFDRKTLLDDKAKAEKLISL